MTAKILRAFVVFGVARYGVPPYSCAVQSESAPIV